MQILFFILFIVIMFGVVLYSDKMEKDPIYKGEKGEKLIENILRQYAPKDCIFRNVYIIKPNGVTTEIDLIMVSRFGVFVIESKNYSGVVYGSISEQMWQQERMNVIEFYNPIKQNRGHISALKTFLEFNDDVYYSMIVFGNNAIINGDFKKCEDFVLNTCDLIYYLNYLFDNEDLLSEKSINYIKSRLNKCTNRNKAFKEMHINRLNR